MQSLPRVRMLVPEGPPGALPLEPGQRDSDPGRNPGATLRVGIYETMILGEISHVPCRRIFVTILLLLFGLVFV